MIMGTYITAKNFIYSKNVSLQLEAAQADSSKCSAQFIGCFRNRCQFVIRELSGTSCGRPVRKSLC